MTAVLTDADVLAPEEVPPPGRLGAQVASGVRWMAIDQLLQQLMRITVNLVLVKLTLPVEFGLIALALVITQIASFVTDVGMGPALVQRRDLRPEHVRTALTITTAVGLGLAALVVALSRPIAEWFRQPELAAVLVVLALNFPLKGLTAIPRDLLRRQLRFRPFVVSTAVGVLTAGVAAIVVAVAGGGVWALVVYSVGESAVTFLVATVLAVRLGALRLRFGFERRAAKDLLGFGAAVSAFKVLYYAQINADNLIVGRVLGPTALGYYDLAYTLMLYPIQRVGDALAQVALPAFSAIQDDLARLRANFERGIQTITVVCLPMSLGILVAAPVAIPFLLGSRWAPAIAPVQILALNGPRLALNRLNGSVFQAVGKPSWDLAIGVVSLVAYLGAFAVGVRFGIVGVAWGYTIAGYLLVPVNQGLCGKAIGSRGRDILVSVAPIVVAGLALVVAAQGVATALDDRSPLLALAALTLAGAAAYGATMGLLGRRILRRLVEDLRRRGTGAGATPKG